MTMTIKCGRCARLVPAGAAVCPGCQTAVAGPRLISTEAWRKQERQNAAFARKVLLGGGGVACALVALLAFRLLRTAPAPAASPAPPPPSSPLAALVPADPSAAAAPVARAAPASPASPAVHPGARQRVKAAAPPVVYPDPPAELPMTTGAGSDGDGYPLRTADRAGFLALLHHRRFAELTRHVETLQADFEADHRKEYWPIDALDAFATADPTVTPLVDEWVAAAPRSFASFAARAVHWRAIANQRRGTKYISETSQAQLDGMNQAHQQAITDLRQALALRPGLVAAYRQLILIAQKGSDGSVVRALLDRALEACPACFQVRVSYLVTRTPRWGGSYPEMTRFARETARRGGNPKLRLLAGYADWDRCSFAGLEKDWAAARGACDAAVAVGEHWQFLHERGELAARLGDHESALRDLERALALRPGDPEVVIDHARALASLGRHQAAAAGLRLAQRLDPAESSLPYAFNHLVAEMTDAGRDLEASGKYPEAMALYGQALELAPDSQLARARLGAAAALAPLHQAVLRAPDDVEAHVRFDHQLARERRFDEVIALWNRFIARRPDQARAYFERGGAYYNSGKRDRALEDTDRACKLGLGEACAMATRVRAE